MPCVGAGKASGSPRRGREGGAGSGSMTMELLEMNPHIAEKVDMSCFCPLGVRKRKGSREHCHRARGGGGMQERPRPASTAGLPEPRAPARTFSLPWGQINPC